MNISYVGGIMDSLTIVNKYIGCVDMQHRYMRITIAIVYNVTQVNHQLTIYRQLW